MLANFELLRNVGLLSFGDNAEEEEAPSFKKKAIARPDSEHVLVQSHSP